MSTGRASWLQPYHFQAGEDARRNTKGRGKSMTTLIKEALRKKVLCGHAIPNGMEAGEFLSEAIVAHAIKGNAAYNQEIMNRVEGKPATNDVVPSADDRVVIYVPDDGRDKATEGAAGSVPIDPSGHSGNGWISGGLEDVLAADEPLTPHQNGKGLRSSDFPSNGTGDHK